MARDGGSASANERAQAWVRALGSDSFAIRQRAARDLTDAGIGARDALAAACDDPDAEIRTRAREILATICESDFRARLEAFSSDYDGAHHKTLPGWERFSSHFGGSALARQLFVEMQRAEPELLEAFEKGGKTAGETLDTRCHRLIQQASQSPAGGWVPLGTVAALLLVGSDPDVGVDEQLAGQLFPWLFYQPAFQKYSQTSDWAPMLRKLLGLWVIKDAPPNVTAENLKFAAMFSLKTESLQLAARVLADEHNPPASRQSALGLVGRFGGKAQLPMVEKSLADSSVCATVGASNPPRPVEVQVRDVALAVAVQLVGGDLREYGSVIVQPQANALQQVTTLYFGTQAQRDAALEKWRGRHGAQSQPE
jgi:hypothetical protein